MIRSRLSSPGLSARAGAPPISSRIQRSGEHGRPFSDSAFRRLRCASALEPVRPDSHSTHSRNTPKQQPNTQASAASNKQRTHQLRPTPPSALSGSSTRGPSTHPKSYVVERAIPRLHRSPTRKTLPPSDPHRPTADALPVRLPVVKVLPIPDTTCHNHHHYHCPKAGPAGGATNRFR